MMLYWEDLKNQKAYLQETSVARALFFKRAIATAAVLAALSWEAKEPAPVNNFNTNNIEVVEQANTVSYEVEEVTQSNNYYNYIKNIMPSVNKYFPEYSNYFRNVLSKFSSYDTAEKYIVNKRLNKHLQNYKKNWLITNEKDKIWTILIVFDYIEWDGDFIKDKKIVQWTNDIKIDAANWILQAIKREYNTATKDIYAFTNYLKNFNESTKNWVNNDEANELINYSEKYMQNVKEYIIDAWMIKEKKSIQERIKLYIKLLKQIWREPNTIWKIYINEYYKIKK